MVEIHTEQYLQEFLADPGPKTAFALIKSCQSYLCNIAGSWREPNLSRTDKIREVTSEMMLVLLEGFDSQRVTHPKSILAFVHQRLKRLVKASRGRETAFGLADGLPEVGRANFTPARLEFVDEIFNTVRGFLLGYYDDMAAQVAFLFIHVFPEVPWASRLLAEHSGDDHMRRLEADKKRMATFNQNLRNRFKSLNQGDWREVTEWSSGERSHLAWRIICISPSEINPSCETDLGVIADWRETINRREPQKQTDLTAALRVLTSMKSNFALSDKMPVMAAEEAAPWGEPCDFLLQLVGKVRDEAVVADSVADWPGFSIYSGRPDGVEDPEFIKIAEELSAWVGEISQEKGKNSEKTANKVLKYD